MRFILIFAVAMMLQCVSAALVMDDTKQFVTGGAALPNTVASCPSPSLRTAAVLPEIYGVLSAWLERSELKYAHDDNITSPAQLPTAVFANGYDWGLPFSMAQSNRVVTSRLSWWPLVNQIADTMAVGGPGVNASLHWDRYNFSSTSLGGDDWPEVAWTDDMPGAMPSNRWANIWPKFLSCSPDPIWKTDSYCEGSSALSLLSDLYDGEFIKDYTDLYTYLDSWRSPLTCEDILRGKIGNVAESLTNRTLRLDRNYLTALENALGLCDIIVCENHFPYWGPDIDRLLLSHSAVESASASANAIWSFNATTGMVTIRPDELSWQKHSNVSTITNWSYASDNSYAWCEGSTESAFLEASMVAPLTIAASNLYHVASSSNDTWTVISSSIANGWITYVLTSPGQPNWTVAFYLDGMAGTNTISVSASASQHTRVSWSDIDTMSVADLPTWWIFDPFLLIYGFVDSIDLVYAPTKYFYGGYVALDEIGYPISPDDAEVEYCLMPETIAGTPDAWRSAIEAKSRWQTDLAISLVNNYVGGRIGNRSDMLPLLRQGVFDSAVLSEASRVTSGGSAYVRPNLDSIVCAQNGGGGPTVTVTTGSGGTHTYPASSGDGVPVAELFYSNYISPTNGLPHVSAAAAGVGLYTRGVPFRAKMRWRNCRFED